MKRGADMMHLVELLQLDRLPSDLLREALTHSSYVNDRPDATDNERLEFLGDAVLSVLCSRYLFDRYKSFREGQLSRLRASLVCEDTLAEIATSIDLPKYLLLGKSATAGGDRARPSILAGAVEALLGATYLELGLEAASRLFTRLYSDVLERSDEDWADPDPKSALQEFAPEAVEYLLLEQTGPDHKRWFRVQVSVSGKAMGEGEGSSKKRAEQAAARMALRILRNH